MSIGLGVMNAFTFILSYRPTFKFKKDLVFFLNVDSTNKLFYRIELSNDSSLLFVGKLCTYNASFIISL